MHILYSVFIHFYGILLHFASVFNSKAHKWYSGRKNWQRYLTDNLDKNASYCWIHCASAGEFEQAVPLINSIRIKKKELKIAVSFFSPSGFEMYKDSKSADIFFYLPLDTKQNANELIEILNPDFVIFIRSEIWMNVLNQLHKKNIRVFLVNANLEQKRNYYYQKYLNKNYLLFSKIFETKTYGNTKLEKVISNKEEIYRDEILADFCKDSFVLMLGSSWQQDEKNVAVFYKHNKAKYPELKIIIAPHEMDNTRQKNLKIVFGERVIEYSKFQDKDSSFSILLLDKKGILKYAYRYVDVALIGGGFGKGVHNVTEAAVYGIPTLFGSNYKKFEEVKELVTLQIAFTVYNNESMEKRILELILNPELRNAIKEKSGNYFYNQKNVAEKIISEILPQVNTQ